MPVAKHLTLLAQCLVAWAVFWLIGWPDYYLQYSTVALGVACTVLSVAFSLLAVWLLVNTRPAHRVSRALWLSFYFTVPFAVLDTLYCGVHLGYGGDYPRVFWYLTVFYVTPWLTFLPTAWLLQPRRSAQPGAMT